jgi:hypothetical protein
MKFYETVEQIRTRLQREGRISYRVLKREFAFDDEDLEDLKSELIDAKRVAVDENGKVLVWIDGAEVISSQWLCCRNSHGDEMPVVLRCETQENQGKVSSPQLAGV